jgi:SAM-dependent methyltransferase
MADVETHPEAPGDPEYGLGHSGRELERLQVQARMLEPFTRQLLLEAGVEPGMRVLDVGSGVGDVAFVAAQIVGAQGQVVGTDRAAKALDVATTRAKDRSMDNVSFLQGDPTEMNFGDPFDAAIGRYVLAWQKDPGAMFTRLIPLVRPGGIVAFHELEWAAARSFPPVESWDRCCRLAVEAMTAGGADLQVGMKLHSLFLAAGLPAPSMHYVSIIGSTLDHVRFTTDIIATLLPDMERRGIVKPGDIDLDTLTEDVWADIANSESVVVGRSEIGAWSRKL